MNPFNCSVWAKSSSRAIVFSHASLTLRVSDNSIGDLWLDALHRCNLSSNLEGLRSIVDHQGTAAGTVGADGSRVPSRNNRSDLDFSDSDDGDQSTKQLECLLLSSNATSESNSLASFQNTNNNQSTARVLVNGGMKSDQNTKSSKVLSAATGDRFEKNQRGSKLTPSQIEVIRNQLSGSNSKSSIHQTIMNNDNNNNTYGSTPLGQTQFSSSRHNLADNSKNGRNQYDSDVSSNSTKMVAKFARYKWEELQLDSVNYVGNEVEELGSAGVQSEEVHDSNKNFLWHIIKQLRPGMDLSKVTLPTFILEPRSFLEKLADYYYHCDILSEAVTVDDPVLRMINIVKWYLSGFYKKPKGPKKPYNPILGEKFRCFWYHPKTQSRTFFVAEQVSHHPPISAFHVSNRKDGYTIICALLSRSKYGGNSVSAILDGKAKLHLTKRNETYTITMPYANCRGILLGSLCLELGGKVEIECAQTGCLCELDFKIAPMWGNANSYNSLTGKILKDNKVLHTLDGHWDKKINLIDKQTEQKSILWEVTDTVRNSRLRRYTVSLPDQQERESVKLWSKVTEALQAGDQTQATAEKTILEDMQRKEARERVGTFIPEHFENLQGTNEFLYRWLDNRVWDLRRDIMQFEDNFKIRTLMLDQNSQTGKSSTLNPILDMPLTQLSKFADQIKAYTESERHREGTSKGSNTQRSVLGNLKCQDTIKTIESKIAAGTLLFEEKMRQFNEKNRRLEEDIAILKRARGKRTLAFFMTALVIAILGIYLKYFV